VTLQDTGVVARYAQEGPIRAGARRAAQDRPADAGEGVGVPGGNVLFALRGFRER